MVGMGLRWFRLDARMGHGITSFPMVQVVSDRHGAPPAAVISYASYNRALSEPLSTGRGRRNRML